MSDTSALSDYRRHFDYDVFVSYAHVDDDRIGRERVGWVTQFHEDLSAQIRVYLGYEVRVWRDSDIRSNEDFEKKIANRLGRVATFLPVVSASFVNSEWCIREVREFAMHADRHHGMLVEGEKKRVFKVERIPTDRAVLPDELQGTTTYKFFIDNKRPLRPTIDDRDGAAYYEKLIDLATDVANTMKGLARAVGSGPSDGSLTAEAPKALSPNSQATQVAARRVVYMAETTFALDDTVSELRRDLKDRGYIVLPDADLPRRARDYRSQVAALLSQADVAVHLVDDTYGFVPEGDERRSNVWIQQELALDRAKTGALKQIIWMNAPTAKDDRQQAFLEYLRTDSVATAHAELLEGGVEDLKTEIYDTFDRLEKSRAAAASRALDDTHARSAHVTDASVSANPLQVYVMCDRADRKDPDLVALRKYLLAQGLEPILPTEGETEGETIEIHRERMADCDGAIIFYGAGSPRWFDAKLNDMRKLLRNRAVPVLAKAIYIAGPTTPDKEDVETNEAIVFRPDNGFAPDEIAPFVSRLLPQS